MKEYKLFIRGKWESSRKKQEIRSPYDGNPVALVHFADKNQVKNAVDAAHESFKETRKLSSYERSQALAFMATEIAKRKEELAQSITLCSGKTITSSRIEVDRAVNTFSIASEEAKRLPGEFLPLDLNPQTKERWGLVRRFPIGVIAGITPFNFPLNLVAHKVAPALAAGNTVLLRPASQVSPTSILLGEIFEKSGYPSCGLNVIPCGYEAAEHLLDDDRIKMITFTGSPEIGWDLKKRAHKKKVTLELGGNAAVIIEPDADMDLSLPRVVLGSFSYSGQICISIQRIFLHEDIYDRFMDAFIAAVKKLKMGDPLEENTDIGPMINEKAALQTEEWVQEAVHHGARIIVGGKREGSFFVPTILENVKPELRISWLEAFAPVVVVTRYSHFKQALDGVNFSIYGLQAGLFSNDLKKAFQAYEELDVGGVIINDIPTFRIDHMPYGGIKESGFGREGLKYALEEMTEMKLMALNLKYKSTNF
ncbi:MAG: aldehyde dehydrogenase family protein [Candidatus Aminicenantes bacterium]|nr:aldehyde dehydrogenase family protein [Candidatus Aminicenantes bacterium]